MKGNRFGATEEIKKIETGAAGNTKQSLSVVFREFEQITGISVLYLRGGYFEGEKIVVDKYLLNIMVIV